MKDTFMKDALDDAYLRGQLIALLRESNNLQSTINKIEEELKERDKNEKK
jgi:hypothetical protein|tara:strand:+ start:170 stop:319 length:150 start_codon:yes stop_codon:yes gene_type:complete